MALSRRTGQRFQGSIWPGFVDAMTGLLLVLMFLLTIFMVVQFVLRETISGQETELDQLAGEVSALASALGLEERRSSQLDARLGALTSTLNQAQQDLDAQSALIASLTAERSEQDTALAQAQTRITSFEAQVVSLLADRDRALGTVADLRTERQALLSQQADLLSEQEALNLALAQSRTEVDAQSQAARLAAARREALEALVADLQTQEAQAQADISGLSARIGSLEQDLTDEEAARLAEAAAAEVLRARLENADAELTAMTLSLEAQRKEAEDTLTLLAATEAVRDDLDARLIAALTRAQTAESQAQDRDVLAERLTLVLAQMEVAQAETATTVTALQAELSRLQTDLLAAEASATSLGQSQTELESQLVQSQAALAVAQATVESSAQERAALEADLSRTRAELAVTQSDVASTARDRADIESRLLQALESLERVQAAAASDQEVLRARLIAALAAQEAAQADADSALSVAEQRATLLAAANQALSEQRAVSAESERQTALLNQQVAALRTQLGNLQNLLDEAKSRDVVAQIQLESLGSELNVALARVASEERTRRKLEEDERKRLEAEAKALAAQAENLEKYRSEFFGRLREVLGNQEGVRIVGDRFVFSSEVLFPPGAAELSSEGRGEIAKIAGILRSVSGEIPDSIDWVIRVDGHTDNVPLSGLGAFADNWELSQARALSVVRYMINFLGIPPERLAANGFGQYQPINPGDSENARAQNRRIELKLTEK